MGRNYDKCDSHKTDKNEDENALPTCPPNDDVDKFDSYNCANN